MAPILSGSTIGILGGGQLGRMTAMAARSLGYHVHVLDPDESCAARFVVERALVAPFDDELAAADLARRCQVVTLEIEKVSLKSLETAARYAPVRPSAKVLGIIQDRGVQKRWLVGHGFPVGPHGEASTASELSAVLARLGDRPAFVKACTGGYDGQGQFETKRSAEGEAAFAALGGKPVVAEAALDIALELSVLVARRPGGQLAVYAPAVNHHENRILSWSVLPGPLPEGVAKRAQEIGCAIAEQIEVEGLLVIELFLTTGGELFVNELAPRPHNSFHATEVACPTSQFEQLIRAVCDLPLGAVEVVRPTAIANLLGELFVGNAPPSFEAALSLPGVRVHLYGKRQARPGRKMGHLTAAAATPEDAVKLVREAYSRLTAAGK